MFGNFFIQCAHREDGIPLVGKLMFIEYPVRINRLEKTTDGYKEMYVCDEDNPTWNEIGSRRTGR